MKKWLGLILTACVVLGAWYVLTSRPTVTEMIFQLDGDQSTGTTPIPTESMSPVSLAVVGDFDTDTGATSQVAQAIASYAPDYLLTTGDNGHGYVPYAQLSPVYGVYRDSQTMYPTLGNHDDVALFAEYYAYLGGRHYYSHVFGDNLVEVFFLNSNWSEPDGNTVASIQANWLQSALSVSSARFKLVLLHEPPFASCDRYGTPYNGNESVRWPFAAWGADLVMSGHCHNYERLLIDGIPYVVAGLGGGGSYGFSQPLQESLIRITDVHGYTSIEATSQALTIKVTSIDGQIIDGFMINK